MWKIKSYLFEAFRSKSEKASECFNLSVFASWIFRKWWANSSFMTKDEIDEWAKDFAGALSVGGERVPLDRVIASRLAAFQVLRKDGLTWRAIAAILTRAGARRKDNLPISADQLRADVSRLLRHRQASIKAFPPSLRGRAQHLKGREAEAMTRSSGTRSPPTLSAPAKSFAHS